MEQSFDGVCLIFIVFLQYKEFLDAQQEANKIGQAQKVSKRHICYLQLADERSIHCILFAANLQRK